MADNNTVNQTVENDDMAYASMAALQQQEELEQDAYNRGDMDMAYSADTYQTAIDGQTNLEVSEDLQRGEASADVLDNVQADATEEKKYNNVFASMFHKVANVFGTDSAIGSKFEEVANSLEERYGTDAHEVQEQAMQARMNRGTLNQDDSSYTTTTTSAEQMQTDKSPSEDYTPTVEKQSSRDEQLKESNDNMKKSADLAVQDDDFLSMKDAKDGKFQTMSSSMNVMGRELQMNAAVKLMPDNATAEDYSDVSNSYMTMARGIKAYNDEALEGINAKYKDDPEKLETAKAGLGNLMNHASENLYGIIGESNKSNNFLSDADKKELDAMNLQGVTTKYSDYVKENNLEPQTSKSVESVAKTSDTKADDVTKSDEKTIESTFTGGSKQTGITSRVAQRETATASRKADATTANRGQIAEDRFKNILDKENTTESSFDMCFGK